MRRNIQFYDTVMFLYTFRHCLYCAAFEVFTAVLLKVYILWDVTSCRLLGVDNY